MNADDFIKLGFLERYEYTLNKIAQEKGMWILRKPDNKISVNVGVNKSLELLIWAEEAHASYNLVGVFATDKPEFITYKYFLDDVLPRLEKNEVKKVLLSTMQETRGKIITSKAFIDYISRDEK